MESSATVSNSLTKLSEKAPLSMLHPIVDVGLRAPMGNQKFSDGRRVFPNRFSVH